MDAYRPDAIFLAAAKVGGILANDTQPADFLYENLIIEANVLHAAHMYGVKRIMFLGSSCIYPKFADQPISEDSLLTGSLEPTNQWYAIAKIAGLKLCEAYKRQYGHDYFSVMPSNLYGPGDNFDLTSSHVLPALIRKAHEAKISQISKITIWGTGTPRREFLYVDDCADACVFLMKRHSGETHVNIGAGDDISILDLTNLVCKIVGFEGEIAHDLTKPDGTPRKVMNVSKLHQLGWQPKTTLEAGIAQTYQAFLRETEQGRGLRRLA
jgi:GDP-L-fucose synthase